MIASAVARYNEKLISFVKGFGYAPDVDIDDEAAVDGTSVGLHPLMVPGIFAFIQDHREEIHVFNSVISPEYVVGIGLGFGHT